MNDATGFTPVPSAIDTSPIDSAGSGNTTCESADDVYGSCTPCPEYDAVIVRGPAVANAISHENSTVFALPGACVASLQLSPVDALTVTPPPAGAVASPVTDTLTVTGAPTSDGSGDALATVSAVS